MDLKMNENGDLAIENGRWVFVKGAEAILQKVKIRLRTLLGEYVYNRQIGVPYREVLFSRQTTLEMARSIFFRVIMSVEGVTGCSLQVEREESTRKMTITGQLVTIDGEIDFSEQVGGQQTNGISS